VLHDVLCRSRGQDGRYTRGECDAIVREAIGVLGILA